MRLRLLGWLTGLTVAVTLLVPTAALATETETIHFSDTFVVSRPNPCTGAGATLTLTFKGVLHITTLDNDTVHVTMMDVGTLTAVPDDPSSRPIRVTSPRRGPRTTTPRPSPPPFIATLSCGDRTAPCSRSTCSSTSR